jgi:tryptophan synthase alpha chain
MSRIEPTFAALKAQGKTGLVTFITAGDPGPELTVPLMHALVAGGADVLELGVPFSDPMAEGPVIQRACERALCSASA